MSLQNRLFDLKCAWHRIKRVLSMPELRWPLMLRRTHDKLMVESNQTWFQTVVKARDAKNKLPLIKKEWLEQGVILEHLPDGPMTGTRHRFSVRKKT